MEQVSDSQEGQDSAIKRPRLREQLHEAIRRRNYKGGRGVASPLDKLAD